MKKFIACLISVLFATTVQAQVTTSDLMGLGMPAALAAEIVKLTSESGSLIPKTDNAYDVGSLTYTYRNGVFTGYVIAGSTTLGAGSAAAPSYNFSGDGDLGAYRVGANQYGISAGGANVATFDSGGLNVTGEVSISGAATSTGVLCTKSNGDIGQCTSAVGAGGTCTCA